MRRLIRPAAFAVARLGLFLALAAWIAGRSHVGQLHVPHLMLECHPSGWVITVSEEFSDLSFLGGPSSRPKTTNPDYDILTGPPDTTNKLAFPGLRCQFMGSWHTVYIWHWLTVTICALFLAALSWIYREHEIAEVGDCPGDIVRSN